MTAGFVSVVDTVTLCVKTGSKFVVTVIVLGSESDSVSCGKSPLLSSCVSEYRPVISYCDSCRLWKNHFEWGQTFRNGSSHVYINFRQK